MMINWKRFGRKRSWPDLKVLFRHSPTETEDNHETSIRIADHRGRDLNLGPPDHDVRRKSRYGD
jgi:hypothetical protein